MASGLVIDEKLLVRCLNRARRAKVLLETEGSLSKCLLAVDKAESHVVEIVRELETALGIHRTPKDC